VAVELRGQSRLVNPATLRESPELVERLARERYLDLVTDQPAPSLHRDQMPVVLPPQADLVVAHRKIALRDLVLGLDFEPGWEPLGEELPLDLGH
jgi:hypothetical protein